MPESLQLGSSGPEVPRLIALLSAQGCAPRLSDGGMPTAFDRNVQNMVLYFQMTHQGRNGQWLAVDGSVGADTWWALENATGAPQRSFLEVGIPADITGPRRTILETAVRQHGICEDPGRPNRGAEVDKFLPREATKVATAEGPPWCCYFASWVVRQALGEHPVGRPLASVYEAWANARKLRRWEPNVSGHVPTPGDAFVILHGEPEKGYCQGHIGFVLQVAADGKSINTVEGNCGNRVKIAMRSLADPQLKGFINVVGDHPPFTRGSLRGAVNVSRVGTRGDPAG